jgi:ferrous iron transport protein A
MHLTDVALNAPVKVTLVDLPHEHEQRLAALGVGRGATVRVTHRAGFGGRVLAVGADRIALDAATCGRIAVAACVPA